MFRSRTGGSLGFKNKISFYLIKVHRFLDHLLWRLMDGTPFYNFAIIGCFAHWCCELHGIEGKRFQICLSSFKAMLGLFDTNYKLKSILMPKLVPMIWTFFESDKIFGVFRNYFWAVEILKMVICELLYWNLGLLRGSFCPILESKSMFSWLFEVVLEFRSCLGIFSGP